LDQDPPHPIDDIEEERQIHHLRTSILALDHPPRPGPSTVVDNDKRQRHVEKQISPDFKNGKKTKPATDLKDRQTHVANNSKTLPSKSPPVWEWCCDRFICSDAAPTTPTMHHIRYILTTERRNQVSSPPAAGAASGEKPNAHMGEDGIWPPPGKEEQGKTITAGC
jgi:hypothetical protein